MTRSKTNPTRGGGSGTAWLAAAWAGSVFATGFAIMVRLAAGYFPPFALTMFRGAIVMFVVVSAVWILTVASRRRAATYGVEILTLAERRRLDADDAANRMSEPAAA